MNRMICGVFGAGMCLLAGCSDGVKEQVRKHDFRTVRAAQRQAQLAAAPSPIANVADMPGWTTDFQGATAFAKENNQRTVVFVQDGNSGPSQKMKTALNASEVAKISGGAQRVTIDLQQSPELASQFQVHGPSVLIMEPSGNVTVRQDGSVNKSQLVASLQ